MVRLILASQSPARLATLRQAGLHPEVIVSGVDEDTDPTMSPGAIATELAHRKVTAVATRTPPVAACELLLGCDSVLEFAGQAYGKPADADAAIQRWRAMSGGTGILHTGHHLILRREGEPTRELTRLASTTVHFAELDPAEIEAYVATGEPLHVAGAFTIDSLGGAFVRGIEGDHHNVVGVSLPLVRAMVVELGLTWPQLWKELAQQR